MEPNYNHLESQLNDARKACESNAECVRNNLRKIANAKSKRRKSHHTCDASCACKQIKQPPTNP